MGDDDAYEKSRPMLRICTKLNYLCTRHQSKFDTNDCPALFGRF